MNYNPSTDKTEAKENVVEAKMKFSPGISEDDACLNERISEKINMVAQVLTDKQPSLKPLAAINKDDPIVYLTSMKYLLSFLTASLVMTYINVSF